MALTDTSYGEYLAKVRGSESGGNPNAKNPRSSASGLYQFTRGTWEGLGYDWGDRFNTGLQNQAMSKLTSSNANYLKSKLGINPSDADLYGAHFLGPQGYASIYKTSSNTPLSSILSQGVISANPFLSGKTTGYLKNWLSNKMGQGVSQASYDEYGVDTSLNLPMNTGEYQTAPDIASKEDLEAEQAKAELLQKQNEKNFIAEVQAQQDQDSQRRQQQEEQYQQYQQQDTGIDEAYYQMPQIALPEYVAPQQVQTQQEFEDGGLIKYQTAGRFKNQTGPMTSRDSVAHQADKILKYEVLRGGSGSAPLDGTNGNPDYRDPRYKKQLMDRIYPEVQKILPNASAIESAEAMDLIFNSGWDDAAGKIVVDPRAYALQEYYRKNDPSKLDENGAWAGRKNAPYSFDKEYANTVGKLSENQRRIFMNKGRDWFYQHRAPKNSSWDIKTQGPHPNYEDTWYGRIWNTNDFNEFNPNNPKFIKKEMGGEIKDGEGESSARISPEARGMGDVGIRYGNSFSTSLGANLQDKNIRTGIDYGNDNLEAGINYTKGLDNTSSFNTNVSYNPGRYNLDFSYDRGPEGDKNLSIGTGYRGKNLSGKLIYDQGSEGKNLSGDVRYGKGNLSGSLGTNFRIGEDFNPNIKGDLSYKNKNLTTSIGANYNRDIGIQPNISATYRFKNGGNIAKYQEGSTFIEGEGETQNYSNLVEEVPVWGGSLDEVVITNNYKAPKETVVANKYPKFSQYREQPVETVMDAVPELQKFAEKNMAKAVNYEEKIKKEEAVNTAVGQKNMKIKLSGKSILEDTVENKDIDLSKYKTPEQAKKLQSFLVSQGYNLDPDSRIGNRGIDGKIGNITKLAVTKYNQHLATPGYESIKEGSGLLGKCTEEQCSEYGQNELYRNMQPEVSRNEWNKLTGLQGSAWDIGKNIIKAGGREVTTKKDGLRPGDVVTMYTGGHSEYQGEADRAGTGTTHTGIIDKVNPDGSYYILHNVHSGSKLTGFEGKEFRDLVKNNNVSTHNFTVRHAFRPAYDKVKKGEKKIVREDLVLRIDPLKQKKLSSGDYNNMFTSASAKDKLENTFLKSFNDTRNKKVFSKKFNLGDDEYNSLAKGSLGILGQEAGFATSPQYTTGAKEAVASVARGVGYKEDEVSRGAGRLKYETNFGKDDLTELGINEDNFDDENNAGLVTMYKLATDYKNFLRKGDNKKDALYKAITVYNSSLGRETKGKTINDFAKDYDVDYTNKVLNFSEMFDVTDNKKSYKTSSDELLLKPNVAKWNTKLKRQNKI